MEKDQQIPLVNILTSTQAIPYEVLKYYGYAHQGARLLHNLCNKTRELLMKIQDTNFFEPMKKIVTLDTVHFKLIIDEVTTDMEKNQRELSYYLGDYYYYSNS